MKYERNWKNRGLKVDSFTGIVTCDGSAKGKVTSQYRKDARSPGGMVTDKVWLAEKYGGDGSNLVVKEFSSQTEAIRFIID